jgi:hypothetical protein
MEQSQLVELIQILLPEEKEQILHFATLPFLNNSRTKIQVIHLLDICLNHPWHDSGQILKKDQVFELLFPDQEFVEGKVEKIMVEAHKMVRSFLLAQQYFSAENDFQQNFDFSEIIRKRGLASRYKQLLTKLQKVHKEYRLKNSLYFHRQFLLEYATHDEESLHNQKKGDLNIPNVLHALEMHENLNRLALLNRFLLQQKFVNLDAPEGIKNGLQNNNIPSSYLDESPFLKINFVIFTLLRKNKPEPHEARSLFDLLLLHEDNLDADSLKEFYTYLRNICVLVLIANSELEEINYTLHELYKDNLERGYLHYEGKLHPSRYLAISENAARVKKHEWALEFIEKHKHEIIGENENQDIYRLNLANYLFGIGQFSNCLDNIPPTSPFVDYLLHGKRLELKALYELQSDLLEYKLDAFKMFLSRTSQKLLSEAQRQIHSDFANLLHQLVYSKSGDPKRSELLVSRLYEKKQSAEWRWLLEKAKALKST